MGVSGGLSGGTSGSGQGASVNVIVKPPAPVVPAVNVGSSTTRR